MPRGPVHAHDEPNLPDLDPTVAGPVEPGTVADPAAYAAALVAGTVAEIEPDAPTCHYCQAPMVQHLGGLKDGCWHAEGGCCFLPGRRELRPGHPPCDTYAKAHPGAD